MSISDPPARVRILFAGYAPVHFVCAYSAWRELARDPRIELWLSGGFKRGENDAVHYVLDGFYDRFDVDHSRVIPLEDAMAREFDVCICAHLSDAMVPAGAKKTVQVFHGVSFKNFAVREKALNFNFLCLPGRYHAEQYQRTGLVRDGGPPLLITGFPKVDILAPSRVGSVDRDAMLRGIGLDPGRKTVLYAPTGGKDNSLELRGEEIIERFADDGRYNLLVKPHDHPKRGINWMQRLAGYESDRMKLVRDWDVVPWLAVADQLITDASSVATEYTLLDRPIVFMDVPRLLAKVVAKGAPLDLGTYGRHIGRLVPDKANPMDAVDAGFADPPGQGAHSEKRRQMAAHVFHQPGTAAGRVAHVVRYAAGLESDLPADAIRVQPGVPIPAVAATSPTA
ncbi:MAG: CDP-glycerol glycerophosphotransferase family protein [Planctomycetota bacterium]